MSQLRKRFIRDLSIRNYSKRTIQSYVIAVKKLSLFYGRCPSEIQTEEIKEYLNHLQESGRSWSTVNVVMSACNRLYQDTLCQPEKMQSIRRPKNALSLPVVFSEQEVANFLKSFRNIKHKAIFMTIYGGGLRCSEASKMKVRDIDSQRSRIIIRDGKGHKDREVILSYRLLKYLRYYAENYRPQEYLFYGHDITKPISNNTIQKIFRKNLIRSGITKNASTHTLRHSFATHLMNKGIDIRIIQQLLGHKSIKTTLKYCHLAKDRFGNTRSPLDDLSIW
ncbi:MAG: site-specific integrase [Saprospiraceae bacterium]|nr:site-specific integrase [Saprospiraceae bacterium]